ncbi:hypothetical protein BAE44_0026095 [Dichanthelium oligosanthes]|uniref:RING-type domain-containing protein n=1 Tax=Dichanthelium oligosanthes TaxID=888268 RepID=A0A1E5UJ27_9POAL|nr:hypothetical protein BAE44_0026095 [Dichanthelium oligosanthes]
MDDTCAVCAETLEWVAYGPCGHRDVCSTCVVRLRFVMDDKKCCICKTVCPFVFVTKALGEYTRVVNDFSVFPTGINEGKAGDFWYHEDTQAYFDDVDHYRMIWAMCRLSCSVCDNAEDQVALAAQAKRRSKFRSIDQLKGHLFHVHRLHMCNLCLEGRKVKYLTNYTCLLLCVFICEQKLYSRSQLAQHMKTGDSEVDGSEVERSGFAGHPTSKLSQQFTRCVDFVIVYRQHPGQYDYFRNYDDLERHNAMEHGGRMSRAQRNAALQIPTSFIYRRNEQDQRRGRVRGRNAHHDGTESHISSSAQNGRATADDGHVGHVENVSGYLQSSSVGSSSGGAEVSSRTGRVLEQLSFPPLSDPDIPDTRVDSVSDETSFPSLSEQQSRYALALNHSARGAARLGDESLFPPLPGSSNNRGPASAQQGLQSLAKSTLAARLQQRNKGPVKVLNAARLRPSENPELLPSSTQTWPTPDQGLLLSGSSQLRIGTQPTRENGFMPAVSSNSAWNPVAPNKMKHSVSTPNLVSGSSSGQASSSTAYGSNRSQETPQDIQALPVAEDVRAANKSLVERMRSALGMDEDRYSAFKEIAGEYRQGIIDTSEYLSYVEQFGLSHLVPEMARLLPDPQKQRVLADAYYTNIRFKSLQENGGGGTSSQEGSRKKKGKGKAPVTESSAAKDVKDAVADNFLDTVRRLQSNHQAQEGEAEVLSKDGYRPSKGVQLSAGSSSSLDSDTGFNSKASGAKDNTGKGGGNGSSKQPKKTSKFLRARLGDNSLATLDLSRPSMSPERPERESQGPQMGFPVRGAWKNGGGHRLFSSNGRK